MMPFRYGLLCLSLLLPNHALSEEDSVRFAVGMLSPTGEERKSYDQVIALFEYKHPKYKVIFDVTYVETYKKHIKRWLAKDFKGKAPDVLWWQAGERLNHYVRLGQIADLNTFWKEHQLTQAFPQGIREVVFNDGAPYAIPFVYYPWGMYYRASLLKSLNIAPPVTWDQLLPICQWLKAQDRYCFGVGTKETWPAAGWFDYLNMRMNGLSFHRALVKGEQSYKQAKVRQVFVFWKSLLDKEYFLPGASNFNWNHIFPFLYRKEVGFTLIGHFAETQFTELKPELRQDLRFLRFPAIRPEFAYFEDAPTDVFILHRQAANKPAALAFLEHLALPETQASLGQGLKMVPVHTDAFAGSQRFQVDAAEHLRRSKGFAQYFDRDAPQNMEGDYVSVFKAFLENPDVDKTLEQLESIRLQSSL